MKNDFILWLEVFIFILACLNLIKNMYKICKILLTHEGKFELTNVGTYLLGGSISYILTTLIIGFN